jgi:predicted GNAT superfamily acetyltransferase
MPGARPAAMPSKPRRPVLSLPEWRPEFIISAFTRSQMAAFVASAVLPSMDLEFRSEDVFSFMERTFGLDADDLPDVRQGKPGLRKRWRQQTSDALTILLEKGVLRMVATRRYTQVTEDQS